MFEHRVQDDQQFPHTGDERCFLGFSQSTQALIANKKRGHSEFPVVAADGAWRERKSPEARGPAVDWPGRKAETDRVCEGISEGVPSGRAHEGRTGRCERDGLTYR